MQLLCTNQQLSECFKPLTIPSQRILILVSILIQSAPLRKWFEKKYCALLRLPNLLYYIQGKSDTVNIQIIIGTYSGSTHNQLPRPFIERMDSFQAVASKYL